VIAVTGLYSEFKLDRINKICRMYEIILLILNNPLHLV